MGEGMDESRHAQNEEHAHGVAITAANERKVAAAAALTGGFMIVELIGGAISGSLALIADASHMLTDFGSLSLAWLAFRIARRPTTWRRSYGFDRFSVLAAFVNGLALFAIAAWICWEAWKRFGQPAEIVGPLMFWVAIGGLIVNLVAYRVLSRGETRNINVRAAALHVMGDLLGSAGAIVASIVIMTTGFLAIDPILSVFVSLIILRSAWGVVKESAHILLQGAPANLDPGEISAAIRETVPGAAAVHHVHVTKGPRRRDLTARPGEHSASLASESSSGCAPVASACVGAGRSPQELQAQGSGEQRSLSINPVGANDYGLV